MKTLKITTVTIIAVIASVFFFGCEDATEQEIARHQIPVPDGGWIPKPTNGEIPYVKRIVKRDFREAKGWRIIWGGNIGGEYNVSQKIPGIFSTVTGSVNSIQYLNNTNYKNTDNADMWLFNNLKSTSETDGLTKTNYTKKTRFKLSLSKKCRKCFRIKSCICLGIIWCFKVSISFIRSLNLCKPS